MGLGVVGAGGARLLRGHQNLGVASPCETQKAKQVFAGCATKIQIWREEGNERPLVGRRPLPLEQWIITIAWEWCLTAN